VHHALALVAIHDLPQLGGELRVALGGEIEPLGYGARARVRGRLEQDARFEQALDDRVTDAQKVDAGVDEGVIEIKDDDRPGHPSG
jgi:hypothetical protein